MNKKRGDLPKKKRTKSAEEIQNENEFLKMSLMAEFGGEFFGDSQIPSDIENAFPETDSTFSSQASRCKANRYI
jgi:hypothetical protein